MENYIPDHVPPELVKPFDLFNDPLMSQCPFDATEKLRENGRIFWNPTNPDFGGSWAPTRAKELREILTQPELFVNKSKAEYLKSDEEEHWDLIPLELDGERHTKFRKLLNPLLSPPAVMKLSEGITTRAVALIDAVKDKGECDFMRSFSVPFPVGVFMELMGLPDEDTEMLLKWEAGLLHTADNKLRQAAAKALANYLIDLARRRKANPVEDIASYVVHAEIDGQALTEDEVKGVLYLLYLAGLDTVGASLGWMMHHLATHPDQQRALRDNPAMLPKAIEELLRRYSIIVSHRQCTRDIEIAGVTMKQGDWITIVNSLGSTDPDEFDCPLDVKLDRGNSRHFGFSFGAHFCMGAHLARRELEIAMREWLVRVPEWRIKEGVQLKTHGGVTFSYENLNIVW